MTQEQQRIAIAEWRGWRIVEGTLGFPPKDLIDAYLASLPRDLADQIAAIDYCRIPDYPNDLNAMHEAEKKIPEDKQDFYVWLLIMSIDNHMTWKPEEFPTINVWEFGLTEGWFLAQATSQQRSEALCRILWPERFEQ